MNIHSVMALNALARRSDAPPGPKRDAILRAATDVFAERGFFNAQVADVARAAGVAAGTVYLYFKGKDDLLISIFERSMREGLATSRAAVADLDDPRERLLRLARAHLARLGNDRNLAIVFQQVELRQSTKFMERLSATLLRDYLGLIREAIADGQREGLIRTDVKATAMAKMLFGALDEMATNWILSRRRRYAALETDADRGRRSLHQRRASEITMADMMRIRAAVLGAGTMGAQIAAQFANAGVPVLLLDMTVDVAREGLKRARAQARSVLHAGDRLAHHDRRLRHGPREASPTATGSSRRWSSSSTSSAGCSRRSTRCAGPASIVSSNTSGIPIASLAEGRSDDFRRHWLGMHFFNPPRYLRLVEVIPTADTDPAVVDAVSAFRRSPPRQGRRGREGHAELHRQPHRTVRRRADR